MEAGLEPFAELCRALADTGIEPGRRLVLAVSGGADSVALTRAAAALRTEMDWRLLIAHVQHGIRGQDAREDALFVKALAGQLDIEFRLVEIDVPRLTAERSGSSQEAVAREARYASLYRALEEWQGHLLLTAHTRDDQAETLLLHLMRGAGLTGLASIRPRRGRLVRPFLDIPRRTILAALEALGQEYRTDATNADVRHLRNAIRHSVLPVMREVSPGSTPALARAAALLQTDADYLEAEGTRVLNSLRPRLAGEGISVSAGPLRSLHPAVRRIALRQLIAGVVGNLRDVEARHVAELEALVNQPTGSIVGQLPRGLSARVREGRLFLSATGPALPPEAEEPAMLSVPGTIETAMGSFAASILPAMDPDTMQRLITVRGPFNALLDGDSCGASLLVRTRRPGDRVHPVGMHGSRKLQDVLVDRKVPADTRNTVSLLATDKSIVWVPGIVLDRRFAATPATESVVHVRFWASSSPER